MAENKKIEEKSEEAAGEVASLGDAKKDKDAVEVATPKKKKKIKRQIQKGQAHIQCSYNNTLISISDLNGEMLAWSSSGLLGFKGAKKSTPFAATQVAGDVAEKIKKYGVGELEVYVKGVGSGREASIRSLANRGFNLILIKDVTPIPHNGCRPRKPRRV
ncbi:MAG: 30S ribosomal protein S11 [bacterium]|nr:30S ribosomal protein S11 [bacterium]